MRLLGKRSVDPGSSFRKFPMDAALAALAFRVAATERPALIHGHLHEGALIGWTVARSRRVPLEVAAPDLVRLAGAPDVPVARHVDRLGSQEVD